MNILYKVNYIKFQWRVSMIIFSNYSLILPLIISVKLILMNIPKLKLEFHLLDFFFHKIFNKTGL